MRKGLFGLLSKLFFNTITIKNRLIFASRQMKSLGERELPNVKNKGGGNKFSEGLYFLMDVDVRYGKRCCTNLAVFFNIVQNAFDHPSPSF